MKIFGVEFNKAGTVQELQKSISEVKKELKLYEQLRPPGEDLRYSSISEDGVRIPVYPIPEEILYAVTLNSDIYQTVTMALRNSIFKRGFLIEELGENPQEEQKLILLKLIHEANENGQELDTVLGEVEDDVNRIDNGYLIAIKDYFFGPDGDIIPDFTDTKEFIRGSPLHIKKIADDMGRMGYTNEGDQLFVDPTERNHVIDGKKAKESNFINPKTGKKYQPAHYRARYADEKDIYYIEDEILHLMKYHPSLLYGYAPTFAIWMKILTLIEMDRFSLLAYQKRRPPRALLAINTTNFDAMWKAWEKVKAETVKDPHTIHPLVMESKEGKGAIQFIDLMKSLEELQFIEHRNEMRRSIGAIYGVMPLFSGDIAQIGGLNNESQQITITNKAVERGQKIYNRKVLPWILKQLKITDYKMTLEEAEERDETEEIRRMSMKIENAQRMSSMGFEVSFNEDEAEFTFSEEATQQPTALPQDPSSPFGGLPEQSFGGEPATKAIEVNDLITMKDYESKVARIVDMSRQEIEKQSPTKIETNPTQIGEFVKFVTSTIWGTKFENLSKQVSETVKDRLLVGILEKKSLQQVIDSIKNAGVKSLQAEMIARTESTAIQNKIREFNFINAKGARTFKYRWIGPADNRTSEICKEIKQRTKKGVSLARLRKIVDEVAIKHDSDPREWVPHVSCRHTFTRVI